jgi:hypothetical protein
MTQYLTPAQVAKALQVSERTLRRWPIPRCKVGGVWRYDPADVEAYMRSLKQGPAVPVTEIPHREEDQTTEFPIITPRAQAESLSKQYLNQGINQGVVVRHRNKLYILGGL